MTGIIAAFAGGFIASRMSGRTLASSGALHGLTTLAVTTLFLLYLLTTAIGGLVGGALNGNGAIAGSIGNTVATAAEQQPRRWYMPPTPLPASRTRFRRLPAALIPKLCRMLQSQRFEL